MLSRSRNNKRNLEKLNKKYLKRVRDQATKLKGKDVEDLP